VEHVVISLRRRERGTQDSHEQALLSANDWHRPGVRFGVGGAHAILFIVLVVVGLGPLLWLLKAAISPTNDTISAPMALFPHGAAWGNLREAWTGVQVDRYFVNTVVLAFGSWASQIIVATTAGFALSVLRPRYG
jgi:multiple sugar transport system permease protein